MSSRNIRFIQGSLRYTKDTKVIKGRVVDKVIFLRNYQGKTQVIPQAIYDTTLVAKGRTKEFYSNPEWRAKAEEIKQKRKMFLA